MSTTFCTQCLQQFDYTLQKPVQYVLCSHCRFRQSVASFWHSYWGGNYPDYSALKNLSRWSRHLHGTAFLPILWTNRSAYNAICHNVERGNILPLSIVCKQNERSNIYSSLFTLAKKLGDDFPVLIWRTRPYISFAGQVYAKPLGMTINARCPLLVIDYEAFLENEERKALYEGQKNFFRAIIKIFRILNNNSLFAFAKDENINLILSYLGGMYFDIDLSPKEQNNFFHSMSDISLNISAAEQENALIECPLIKFDNPNLMAKAQEGRRTLPQDVGFKLYPNSFDFLNKDYNDTFLKSFISMTESLIEAEYIDPYKNSVEKYKMNYDAFYPFRRSLESTKAIDWMKIFRRSKKEAGDRLYNTITLGTPIPLMAEMAPSLAKVDQLLEKIRNLVALMFEKQKINIADHWPKNQYALFYLHNLYDKFEQVSDSAPSSTFYTGYQDLEKMKKA